MKKETDIYWQSWVKLWVEHVERQTSVPPPVTGKECKGLKNLRKYFLNLISKETGEKHTEEEALKCFEFILVNWETLSEFRRKNLDVMYVYSHIHEYIGDFKQSKGKLQHVVKVAKESRDHGLELLNKLL
jgi:hypothetical protein